MDRATFYGSGNSRSSNWNPLKPLGGETPNFWYKDGTRSGMNLPDVMGGDPATILLPYYNTLNGSYLYCEDNTALNIGTNDFTLCGWIKSELASKASGRYVFGKLINSAVQGYYGFYMNATTGYIVPYMRTSTGLKSVSSTVDFTTCGVIHVRFDVNQTTNVIRFFINNVQIGVDTAFTGSVTALSSDIKFMFGGTQSSLGVPLASEASSFSDVYVFNRLLTPTEATAIYNREIVTGAKAHWPFVGSSCNEFDTSGNGYDLKGPKLTKQNYGFDTWGTPHALENGYTVYELHGTRIYVPALDNGNERVSPTLPTGFVKLRHKSGSSTSHNMANSKILLPSATWDKSDVSIFSGESRILRDNWYVAGTPKLWHIEELNNIIINNNAVSGKQALNFVKCGFANNEDRLGELELFSYDTNKSGADLTKIQTYLSESVITDHLDYYFQTLNIVAQNGDSVLTWDDARYLKLTINGVDINTLDLNGVTTQISFGHIFDNGNIIFATHTKVYLSTDDLDTYAETTVKGIDGNAYSPTLYNNFRSILTPCSCSIGGVSHLIWGNYTVEAETEYININIWQTIDSGVTIESIFKVGTTLPITARHIHSVTFNSDDESIYISTGDLTLATDSHVIRGVKNTGTGVWTFTDLLVGKLYGGVMYKNGYLYMPSDNVNADFGGLWKVAVAEVADISKHVRVFSYNKTMAVTLKADGDAIILGVHGDAKRIFYSYDGKLFLSRTLVGGPVLDATYGNYYGKDYANSNGYLLLDIHQQGENLIYWQGQSVLLAKTV